MPAKIIGSVKRGTMYKDKDYKDTHAVIGTYKGYRMTRQRVTLAGRVMKNVVYVTRISNNKGIGEFKTVAAAKKYIDLITPKKR